MTAICLYLQASSKDVVTDRDASLNYREIFQTERFLLEKPRQVYHETNEQLQDWLHHYPELNFNLSLPTWLLEQLVEYNTNSEDFRQLAHHHRVDVLSRVYKYPSPKGYSLDEFAAQLRKYLLLLRKSLGVAPFLFHSDGLQLTEQLAKELTKFDLGGVINSNSDVANRWCHPDFLYHTSEGKLKILIENQAHSEELRRLLFKNDPELVENFLITLRDSGEVVNLFINYEDLHSGVNFFEEFLAQAEQNHDVEFLKAKRVVREYSSVGELDSSSLWMDGVGKRIVSSALGLFNWIG